MADTKQTEKKKMNPILWFLFAIVIPVSIVLVIIFVILSLAGFNVLDWTREKGSELPVVSNFVSSPEEVAIEEEISRLEEELEMKDEEIEQLEFTIDELEGEIVHLEQEISSQEEIIANFEAEETDEEDGEETDNDSLSEMAKTFEEMKAKGAAQILENMTEEEVVIIMRELPNDVRGDILEAMDAEIAASIAAQLMN